MKNTYYPGMVVYLYLSVCNFIKTDIFVAGRADLPPEAALHHQQPDLPDLLDLEDDLSPSHCNPL